MFTAAFFIMTKKKKDKKSPSTSEHKYIEGHADNGILVSNKNEPNTQLHRSISKTGC